MFIATQGPLKQTVEHFWTMIKKEEVKLIFMLANLFEEGRSKCEMYWPKKRDTPITFDAIGLKVFLESEDYILDKAILRRNFILHDTINDTKRNVSQLHVVCWPDHSAPNEELGIKMIEILLFYTAEFKLTHKGSPIVVHCR